MADAEFVKSCADTPLMRDVLQERDTLREHVEALTQALLKLATVSKQFAEVVAGSEFGKGTLAADWPEVIFANVEAARKLVEEK